MSPNLRAFAVLCALSAAALPAACGNGERGLVLGAPLPEVQPTSGGSTGGIPLPPIGGEPGSAGIPDQTLGGAGSDMMTAAGAPGAAGAGTTNDPPWVGEKCTPELTVENRDMTTQGQLFDVAMPDPSKIIWGAAHDACRLLYRDGSEIKTVTSLSLIAEDFAGIASTGGTTVRLSTRYLKQQSDRGVDLTNEVTGIMHFQVSLIFQNNGADVDPSPPSWLVLGIADYVRLESGYGDYALRVKGGSYSSSTKTTAFFLDYLKTRNADVVYLLNRRLRSDATVWSNDAFSVIMGSDVDTLWADYQSTL